MCLNHPQITPYPAGSLEKLSFTKPLPGTKKVRDAGLDNKQVKILDWSIGLPRWLSGWKLHLQCWRHRRCWFDPWVRKILWRRAWQPAPVLLPGESPWTESLADYSPWSCKESDMTERLSTIPHALLLGESMYFWEASQYMIPSGTISGISNSSATSPERIPSLTLTHNLVNHWVQANLSGLNYSFQRIFQPNSFWGMPFGLAFGEGNTRSLETHASLGFSRNIMFDYSWFTVP